MTVNGALLWGCKHVCQLLQEITHSQVMLRQELDESERHLLMMRNHEISLPELKAWISQQGVRREQKVHENNSAVRAQNMTSGEVELF